MIEVPQSLTNLKEVAAVEVVAVAFTAVAAAAAATTVEGDHLA